MIIIRSLFSCGWAICLLLAITSFLSLPLVFSKRTSNYTWDETQFHVPAVRQIQSHWPHLYITADSFSATAPGYHYLLASLAILTGSDVRTLRLVNFGVSLLVVVLLSNAWPASTPQSCRVLSILPLAASNFFIKSASFVVTDNMALLATTIALLALLKAPAHPRSGIAIFGATLAIWVRQSTAWLLAPLLLGFWIMSARGRFIRNAAGLLLPLGSLTCLYWAWQGLVPPQWKSVHYPTGEFRLSSVAFQLAVLALLAPAYLLVAEGKPPSYGWPRRLIIPAALGGLLMFLAADTSSSHLPGHWGGYLWVAAAYLPAWKGYSLLFLILVPVGASCLALIVDRLWMLRDRSVALVWLAAYVGWTFSGMLNRENYQRYFEPTTLLLLILWLMLVSSPSPTKATGSMVPLRILGVLQVVITLLTADASLWA